MELARTRSCRVVTSEAGVDSSRVVASSGVPVRKAGGDTWASRITYSGGVPRVWCSGRPTLDMMNACVTAKARNFPRTPAVGPRDPPLCEAGVLPPPSGTRCALERRQGPIRMDVVFSRGEASETRRHRVSNTKAYSSKSNVCRPPSGGSPERRKRWPI